MTHRQLRIVCGVTLMLVSSLLWAQDDGTVPGVAEGTDRPALPEAVKPDAAKVRTLGDVPPAEPSEAPMASPVVEPGTLSEMVARPAQARARLTAVGDILFHRPLIRGLKAEAAHAESDAQESPGTEASLDGPPEARSRWPFTLLRYFANRSDLVIGNLETPINVKPRQPSAPLRFSAPVTIAERLRDAGVGLASVANNHAYDQGQAGLDETLVHLKNHEIGAMGLGREDVPLAATIRQVGKLRFAFLGYSFLTNRYPTPLSVDEAQINLISRRQGRGRRTRLKAMDTAIQAAAKEADYVVVSVHWGSEYTTKPSREQRKLARRMVANGADLILGHHPHVLQPVEHQMMADGRYAVIAYSLGNYIANQSYHYNLFTSRWIPDELSTRDSAVFQFDFGWDPSSLERDRIRVTAHPVWLVNRLLYIEGKTRGRRVEPRLIEDLSSLEEHQSKTRYLKRLEHRQKLIERVLRLDRLSSSNEETAKR